VDIGGVQVKLVDAGFIWTEPHSKRLKVKLTIQVCLSVCVCVCVCVCQIKLMYYLCVQYVVVLYVHSVTLVLNGAQLIIRRLVLPPRLQLAQCHNCQSMSMGGS